MINIHGQIPPQINVDKYTFLNQQMIKDSSFKSLENLQVESFETLNSVKMKRYKSESAFLLEEYNRTISTLLASSQNDKFKPSDEMVELENYLGYLKQKLSHSSIQIDSLDHEYYKDLLRVKKLNVFSFDRRKSQAFFDLVYNTNQEVFSLLNNANFNTMKKSGTISTEILSGYLSIFRVSASLMTVNSAVDNNQLAQAQEAFQRFISTGGNMTLNFEYPILYLHSRNGQFNLIGRFLTKGNADFPQFGTVSNQFSGNVSMGVDFYADAALTNNAMRFFIYYEHNANYASQSYRDNLRIEDPVFSFGQLTLGAMIKDTLKISFIINTHGTVSSLNTNRVVFGGEVVN